MPTLRRRARAAAPAYHHGNLRAALLAAADAMLSESGPAALSLRELARRIGVSHNAPYKHFASREAVLAALATEGFRELAARTGAARPDGGMEAMGLAYIGFALDRPRLFRLMFSDGVDKAAHPDLKEAAAASFGLLRDAVAAGAPPAHADAAAVSAWSFVHGLATLILDGQLPPSLSGQPPLASARAVLRAFGRRPGASAPEPPRR